MHRPVDFHVSVLTGHCCTAASSKGSHRDAALFPEVLVAMCVVTPVSIWAVPKLHELVAKPGLEEQLSTGRLPIFYVTIG